MRKLLLLLALVLISAIDTYAQFEKGKWYINSSYTGIGISDCKHIDNNHGINFGVGNFIDDNFAFIVNYKLTHHEDLLGVQIRYYLSNYGIYGGMGLDYNKYTGLDLKKKYAASFTPEIGYSFFINGLITIEPAIYYNWSLKSSDYSKLGLKLGIGIYF